MKINKCYLKLEGDKKLVKKILSEISSGSELIDFNKIIPAPADADKEWFMSNWGLNCNAKDSKKISPDEIFFTVEDYSPELLVSEISIKYKEINFILTLTCEPGFYDQAVYSGGYIKEYQTPGNCSKTAYEKAAEKDGYNLSDLGYVFNDALYTYIKPNNSLNITSFVKE